MNKLSKYQLWHLHLLWPPFLRKAQGENTSVSSTRELDPCLLSLCHGTRGNLSGGSCPAWQVFSLWEQLTRSDKTTIKNSCSSGCAADSSSSGTCAAPVRMLPGHPAVCGTFILLVLGARGKYQHPYLTDAPWKQWAANSQESSGKIGKWACVFPVPSPVPYPSHRDSLFLQLSFQTALRRHVHVGWAGVLTL